MIGKRIVKITILLVIISGIFIYIKDITTDYKIVKNEQENIKNFLDNEKEIKKKQEKYLKKTNYIAILEIPKINLKKGLVDKNSKENNIDNNIEILKESKLPDEDKSTLLLVGHSGNSKVSFFNNLEDLTTNDNIYIYYKNKKYKYKITKKYEKGKNEKLTINEQPKNNIIFLITCSKTNKNNKLYILGTEITKHDNN